MRPYSSFADLTSDRVLQAAFQRLYGSIDQVDLFMGGLAEAHASRAAVGPTFKRSSLSSFKLCEWATAFSGPVRGLTGELPK